MPPTSSLPADMMRLPQEVFLQQEKVVGQPVLRMLGEERLQVSEALDQHHARAAPALLGLEQRRECDLRSAPADRLDIVEGPNARRRHAEAPQQRRLRG